jgi:hypothetical protein
MPFPPAGYPFVNGDIIDADHVNDIIAVLGADPAGSEATVEARLSSIEDALDDVAPGEGVAGLVVLESTQTEDDVPPGTPQGSIILRRRAP